MNPGSRETQQVVPKKVAIIGAGGCAREVKWTLEDGIVIGPRVSTVSHQFVGYLVSDWSKSGAYDSKEAIIGDFQWLEENPSEVDAVVMGIGDPTLRLKMAEEVRRRAPWLAWPSFAHRSAIYDAGSIQIGDGVVVCAGTVITVNVKLESLVMIHYGSTVSHECRIGEGSVVNPGVRLAGGVDIGRGVMIGAGATVLQYKLIDDFAIIGAGAVVIRDVRSRTTVAGIPAKVLERPEFSAE
jgi:sugar O-acyltransferase (sialic acid O-acetyltransferase NeuD family)